MNLIGIDEAGRGPLAGPVSIGVCMVAEDFDYEIFGILKDSKKLSEKRREEIFEQMKVLQKEGLLKFSVALVSNIIIDTHGISFAIRKGIEGTLKKLNVDPREVSVKLDGSLKAPVEYINQETIIKGDEKVPAISLASIAAKVTRDRYMVELAKEYAGYGFEVHKGYGTKKHIEMIKKSGLTIMHRRTFCGNI